MKHIHTGKLIIAYITAAVAVFAVGCKESSSGSASSDSELHIALNSDIVTMDVQKTSNDYLVPMNVFDTLFTVARKNDGTMEFKKNLIEDYDISTDGLKYHFTLRDDVVFSDGTPLTADDVKFTFERMLSLPDSEQADYAVTIDGAEDVLSGDANELRGITVDDKTHFTITLSKPFSGFLAQLCTPSTCILSRSVVTKAGDGFGIECDKTIGTGPYKITSWTRGSELVFEYNPLYWGEEPSVKKVVARIMDAPSMDMAFQNGDLDILDCMMLDSAIVDSTYKRSYSNSIISVDRLGLNFLMLNEKTEPLSDVTVRRALQMAIDRQSILDSIYNGDGKLEDGIYPEGCLGYTEADQGWLKYDPEAARALLEQAGYPNGFDMELSLDSASSETAKSTVLAIAQDLGDIGVNVSIRTYDHESWLELRNSGNMNSFFATWALDFNDPDNIVYTFFGSRENTILRSNNYSDDATIERIASARTLFNQSDRMNEYDAIEKKLVQDDAVWVPLFSLKHLFVTGDRVADFKPQWAGWSDMYFTDVRLK